MSTGKNNVSSSERTVKQRPGTAKDEANVGGTAVPPWRAPAIRGSTGFEKAKRNRRRCDSRGGTVRMWERDCGTLVNVAESLTGQRRWSVPVPGARGEQ